MTRISFSYAAPIGCHISRVFVTPSILSELLANVISIWDASMKATTIESAWHMIDTPFSFPFCNAGTICAGLLQISINEFEYTERDQVSKTEVKGAMRQGHDKIYQAPSISGSKTEYRNSTRYWNSSQVNQQLFSENFWGR